MFENCPIREKKIPARPVEKAVLCETVNDRMHRNWAHAVRAAFGGVRSRRSRASKKSVCAFAEG